MKPRRVVKINKSWLPVLTLIEAQNGITWDKDTVTQNSYVKLNHRRAIFLVFTIVVLFEVVMTVNTNIERLRKSEFMT